MHYSSTHAQQWQRTRRRSPSFTFVAEHGLRDNIGIHQID